MRNVVSHGTGQARIESAISPDRDEGENDEGGGEGLFVREALVSEAELEDRVDGLEKGPCIDVREDVATDGE